MTEDAKSTGSLTGRIDLYKNVISLEPGTGSWLNLDGKRVIVTVVAVDGDNTPVLGSLGQGGREKN